MCQDAMINNEFVIDWERFVVVIIEECSFYCNW